MDMDRSGPSVDAEDIRKLEQEFGIGFPDAYSKFLMDANGGSFSQPHGIGDVTLEYMVSLYPNDEKHGLRDDILEIRDVLPDHLPIGRDIVDRWLTIGLSDGAVWIVNFKHNGFSRIECVNTKEKVAKSFQALLNGLQERPREIDSCEVKKLARGTIAELEQFLAAGGNVDAIGADGDSILQEAIKHSNMQIFENCLARGASLSGAVHTAVYLINEAALLQLMEAGADVNERTEKFTSPPLRIAVGPRRKRIREILCEYGAKK